MLCAIVTKKKQTVPALMSLQRRMRCMGGENLKISVCVWEWRGLKQGLLHRAHIKVLILQKLYLTLCIENSPVDFNGTTLSIKLRTGIILCPTNITLKKAASKAVNDTCVKHLSSATTSPCSPPKYSV